MKKLLLVVLCLALVPQVVHVEARQITIQAIQQDFDEDWVPENLTSDLLEQLVGILYVGDGSGILEIVFNLIPIIGNNTYGDALLIPIFILLFTGVYWKLKRMGYLN